MPHRIKLVHNDRTDYCSIDSVASASFSTVTSSIEKLIPLAHVSSGYAAHYVDDTGRKMPVASDKDLVDALRHAKNREFLTLHIVSSGSGSSRSLKDASTGYTSILDRNQTPTPPLVQERSWDLSRFISSIIRSSTKDDTNFGAVAGDNTLPNSDSNTDDGDKMSSKEHSQIFSPYLSQSHLSMKSDTLMDKNLSLITLYDENAPSMDGNILVERRSSGMGDGFKHSDVYEFVKSMVENHSSLNGDGASPRQASIAREVSSLLSNEDIVQDIQRFMSSEEVRRLVVDSYSAELEGRSPWDAASVHLEEMNRMMVGVIAKHPGVAKLSPAIVSLLFSGFDQGRQWQMNGNEGAQDQQAEYIQLEEEDAFDGGVEHLNVFCAGCAMKNDGESTAETRRCIQGIRYRSVTVDDFDICQSCESEGKFDESHGPFLKIKNPAQSPSALYCIIGNSQDSLADHVSRFYDKLFSSRLSDTSRNKNESTPSSNKRKLSPSGSARSIGSSISARERGKSSPAMKPDSLKSRNGDQAIEGHGHCENGHPLRQFIVQSPYACRKCNLKPMATVFGCRACQYDICSFCKKKQEQLPSRTDTDHFSKANAMNGSDRDGLRDTLLNSEKRVENLQNLIRNFSLSINALEDDASEKEQAGVKSATDG